jgi:hypothetical protein
MGSLSLEPFIEQGDYLGIFRKTITAIGTTDQITMMI